MRADGLNQTSRDFLESAISDYNEMFHTNFDTSADKFQNYCKDLSMRMKNREIDLVIVGKIVCFRPLKTATDGAILRARNILTAFDEFAAMDPLSERDRQDYQSLYLDNYIKREKSDTESINDDVVFEIELVQQDSVNIDYILRIIEQHKKDLFSDKEVILSIRKAIDSSPELRSKKELIETFIHSVSTETRVTEEWVKHVRESQKKDLDEIIKLEKLKEDKTRKFVENAFRDGVLSTTGTAIDEILPPVPIFPVKGQKNRAEIRQLVIEQLEVFFEKYLGLI